MRANGAPLHRHQRTRGIAAVVVVLALGTASVTIGALRHAPSVAVGGPLAMHHPTSPLIDQLPDDALAPGAPQPVTLAVPAGPHLTVPVLYYHYIRNILPSAQNLLSFQLSIPPALFAEQMALLHLEGAHPITLATLMSALGGTTALPSHPVVLTFDDGYADFATVAEPVLARYGFVATDFVVSGFVNRPRYMSAAQVRQMDADGMVIGSHTVHHVDLAAMTPAAAFNEIVGGRSALESLLGHPILDFAYPYGDFNAVVAQLVQQAGFRDAVTTSSGDLQSLAGRYELHRTEVGGAPSLATFAQDAGLAVPTATEVAVIASMSRQPSTARTA